ncbi:MAG: SDR family oxidoreductase [Gammaproteobacteria bacterium]|nr:SDR family oxidoreductase [Gammaproteobacteria bacterium]
MRVLIAGCGDTGKRLARRHAERGDEVIAQVRSPASGAALAGLVANRIVHDLDGNDTPGLQLPKIDLVYILFPPSASTVNVDEEPRTQALLAALDINSPPARIVYISTTGVYGDAAGQWVDEQTPAAPESARGARRWAAENVVRRWCDAHRTEAIILRVPGIYGPGRLPLARLRDGTPVLHEADAPWSNRIHIDDLATACLLAGTVAGACGTYNVSDGQPSTMTDYFTRLADLAGLPRPPQVSMAQAQRTLSENMLSFLRESRRLDSSRIRDELGFIPRFATLDDGLRHALAEDAGAGAI